MPFSQPVTDYLDNALFDAAQRLAKLERDIKTHLPSTLYKDLSTGGLHGQGANTELVLLVTHAAAATRIRHSLPSLLTYLQSRGWGLSSLRIKIQPGGIVVHDSPTLATRKQAILSDAGLTSLKALYTTLPPSPLRDSLYALLLKHTAG